MVLVYLWKDRFWHLFIEQEGRSKGFMLMPNVELNHNTILITGAAGFIGSNLVLELLRT